MIYIFTVKEMKAEKIFVKKICCLITNGKLVGAVLGKQTFIDMLVRYVREE